MKLILFNLNQISFSCLLYFNECFANFLLVVQNCCYNYYTKKMLYVYNIRAYNILYLMSFI